MIIKTWSNDFETQLTLCPSEESPYVVMVYKMNAGRRWFWRMPGYDALGDDENLTVAMEWAVVLYDRAMKGEI